MNKLIFLLFLLFISSCVWKTTFNKTGWNEKGDLGTWPNRNAMLDDLLKKHTLKGSTYQQLVDSVGEPSIDSNDPGVAYYNITVEYGGDIDPVYFKDLFIFLNKDSVVTGFKVKEWKNGEYVK